MADIPENSEEIIIVDEDVPLGNLPQTGTQNQPSELLTWGYVALAVSFALAGTAILLRKRKED